MARLNQRKLRFRFDSEQDLASSLDYCSVLAGQKGVGLKSGRPSGWPLRLVLTPPINSWGQITPDRGQIGPNGDENPIFLLALIRLRFTGLKGPSMGPPNLKDHFNTFRIDQLMPL